MYDFDFDEQFQEKQPHNKFKFKCVKGCDLCCKMNDIALYPFDIMELCNLLNLTTKEFHQKYTRFEFDSESRVLRCYLITTPKCVFFDNSSACTVYDARPVRCRIFPVARIFSRDGSVKYYLPKEKCQGFFDTGMKHSIQEWLNQPGVADKDALIKQWTSFINELKNNESLPLTDKFFIMFFKKIFYDFDNDLAKVTGQTNIQTDPDDIPTRMDNLYNLAKIYLFQIDKWKQGYEGFVNDMNKE